MPTINKQSAFIRTSILSGITLALLISGLVYMLNSYQTEQIASNNTVSTDTNVTKKNKENFFKITTSTDTTLISSINPIYQINEISTYHISIDENKTHDLTVANYTNQQGKDKKAIIYLPGETTDANSVEEKAKKAVTTNKPSQFRFEKWLATSKAIKKYTNEQSLFVSYWDNAQRIDLFTGRDTWVKGPDKNAYRSKEEQTLWESVAGGLDTSGALSKYSQLLLQDMDTAITELQKELPENRDTYILVSNDDLAHVQEIATLAGQGLPLETKLFSAAADLHNSISKVKEWAKEGDGTGSYLVQPMSEKFNRVWRITDKAFEDSLLVRLLPFTSSLDRPLEKTKLVYQSDWGAYLSIYQVIN